MEDQRTENFLTVHMVAKRLGCSASTIWRRCADGTLPRPLKFGHATRWAMTEVEDFIEATKASRGTEANNGQK